MSPGAEIKAAPRTRRRLFVPAAILLVIACADGCATREARHRTLGIFFDGVPPLADETPPSPTATGTDQTLGPARPAGPKFSVHGPYAARQCNVCHESAFSNRLTAPKEALCLKCHEPGEFAFPFRHGPAAAGWCGNCHHPHRSKLPRQLRAEGEDLCRSCHSVETFAGLDEHRTLRGDECLTCHGPHGGQDRDLRR